MALEAFTMGIGMLEKNLKQNLKQNFEQVVM